jgi:hypothetical protein
VQLNAIGVFSNLVDPRATGRAEERDPLVAVARGWEQGADRPDDLRRKAGFFQQLASGCFGWALAWVDQAGGNLQQIGIDRVSPLTDRRT